MIATSARKTSTTDTTRNTLKQNRNAVRKPRHALLRNARLFSIALRDSTAARTRLGNTYITSPVTASTSTCAPARCAILTSDDLMSSAVPEKDDDDASMTSPRVNLGASRSQVFMISHAILPSAATPSGAAPSFEPGAAMPRRVRL